MTTEQRLLEHLNEIELEIQSLNNAILLAEEGTQVFEEIEFELNSLNKEYELTIKVYNEEINQ
jgi:hypothetical protein